MECPHCQKEIPGKTCPQCGEDTPEESRYCMACGASMEAEPRPAVPDTDDAFDIENRVLCPDGTCTGIIVDGRCTECGKTAEEAGKEATEEPPEQDANVRAQDTE